MNKNILFALDSNTQEVIVSESPKGSRQVIFIERIARNQNEILYNAVTALTSIAQAPEMNIQLFKAMDKACQLIYSNHSESR